MPHFFLLKGKNYVVFIYQISVITQRSLLGHLCSNTLTCSNLGLGLFQCRKTPLGKDHWYVPYVFCKSMELILTVPNTTTEFRNLFTDRPRFKICQRKKPNKPKNNNKTLLLCITKKIKARRNWTRERDQVKKCQDVDERAGIVGGTEYQKQNYPQSQIEKFILWVPSLLDTPALYRSTNNVGNDRETGSASTTQVACGLIIIRVTHEIAGEALYTGKHQVYAMQSVEAFEDN